MPTPELPQTYASAVAAYEDHAAIKALVLNRRSEWAKGRENFIRAAYRNILFYRGVQWIKWDRTINRWRPARLPRNTPTPVTNVFASTMDALVSVFARIEPTLNFRPGSEEEPADRATADVAVRAIQVIEQEVNLRLNRQVLAMWVGLTGGCWLETGYDPDPIHGTQTIEQLDPMTGQPTQVVVPIGSLYVDAVPLFEMFFDAGVTDWNKQRAYLREKSVVVDTGRARWPHLRDVISPNVMSDTESWYGDSLPVLGPQIDENQTGRLAAQAGATRQLNTHVTEQWYWQLPNETYPDGLLAIIVGRQHVAYAGPLPYARVSPDGTRRPFLPHVFFPQKLVPGSAYPKTVADDLAMKQAQRNRWESIIEACGMRMGSPVWLKPGGANVQNLTGDPGNIITYNAVGPNAAKPERIPGQGIPLAFMQMIELIDKTIEELAATFDVIKGARPEGVSAGIALQILQERGMSRYAPLFILWEQAWAQWAGQALEIFREFVTEPRLLKIKGRDGAWQVQKFLGADLQGSVDVIPEAASSMPRSSMLDRAEMEQLASMRIIDITDPEVRWKFLEVYGRTNLTPTMQADTKNAIMENEAFEALAQHPVLAQATPEDVEALRQMPYAIMLAELKLRGIVIPRVRPAVDDHVIHAREIRAWLKSESSQKLPEVVQILGEKHAEYHQELLQLQAQAIQTGAPTLPVQGGYFSRPTPGSSRPQQNPLTSSSSPARLAGEVNEMAGDMST